MPTIVVAFLCHGDLASLANPRYRIGVQIASAGLMAALLSHRRNVRSSVIAVVVMLAVSWGTQDRLPWETKRLGTVQAAQWKRCANYIQEHGVAMEPIYVQSGLGESFLIPQMFDDDVLLDYAGCRMGRFYIQTPHPRIGLPFLWDKEPEMVASYAARLKEQKEQGPKHLWVASAVDTDLNQISLEGFQKILAASGFELVETIQEPTVVLLKYAAVED